jgi:hypothetical protein
MKDSRERIELKLKGEMRKRKGSYFYLSQDESN